MKGGIRVLLISITVATIVFVATSGHVVFLPLVFLPFAFIRPAWARPPPAAYRVR
jgi:hypothetical protein